MATPLPEKYKLKQGEKANDLKGQDKAKHAARTAEEARRKDITQADVAQEALDALEEIEERGGCASEVFTEFGYSLAHVLKPAIKEQARIVAELQTKPSKDVQSDILDVKAVQTKKGIPEWTPAADIVDPE